MNSYFNENKVTNKGGESRMKKFFKAFFEVLPAVLIGLLVTLTIFSTFLTFGRAIERNSKIESLTIENKYLKDEIKWLKLHFDGGKVK